ncbi:DUF1847 domain-containing protein [Thermoanaerobacterium sp. CMT5567-10]|uniref:DUF1847 domain-containing protein n=1 Tax=Thermoanaerobacterium sp. CMT5567-10 TaxID=3061989 RepID=UPI0026DFDBEB|nr:DUF1847 domain-containing protein [Thermoanaerobacterium sp. CMT5567-10]WKV09626.1 DUF1847 domain-containing protein [Thermoanaerobacterium sp. CMT5567-10]
MNSIFSCAVCPNKPCAKGDDNFPKNCPTVMEKDIINDSIERYNNDENVNKIMKIANTLPVDENGELRSRADEIINLIMQMGMKKIGVAFCYSLEKEAKKFVKMLNKYDITVVPVCCKVGSVDVKEIGIEKKKDKFIATCNPITQAEIMNKENTELNVVVGLCVGHDMIFNKNSKAYVTTLVAKDRKYSHCPVKALEE